MCLDVLRALAREPAARDALQVELEAARGADRRYDAYVAALAPALAAAVDDARLARRVAQSIALALQGALLLRHAPPFVADAFCASRLASDTPFAGAAFGTLPPTADHAAIVARAAG